VYATQKKGLFFKIQIQQDDFSIYANVIEIQIYVCYVPGVFYNQYTPDATHIPASTGWCGLWGLSV
jgi:hypothetical protein